MHRCENLIEQTIVVVLQQIFVDIIFDFYLYFLQYVRSGPSQTEILKGMFTPSCMGCTEAAFLQGVGMIGTVIQPHNFFLHSALVKVTTPQS